MIFLFFSIYEIIVGVTSPVLQKKCYVSLHIHCIILYIFSNFVLFLCANPVEIMLAIYIFSYFYIASGTLI